MIGIMMLIGQKVEVFRKLSIVFQLTDPAEYEGGKFEFDNTLPNCR